MSGVGRGQRHGENPNDGESRLMGFEHDPAIGGGALRFSVNSRTPTHMKDNVISLKWQNRQELHAETRSGNDVCGLPLCWSNRAKRRLDRVRPAQSENIVVDESQWASSMTVQCGQIQAFVAPNLDVVIGILLWLCKLFWI